MKVVNLEDKLISIIEEYGEVFPKFILAEAEYEEKLSQAMKTQQVAGLANQRLKDLEANSIVRTTPQYENYITLLTRKVVLEMQERVMRGLLYSRSKMGGAYG